MAIAARRPMMTTTIMISTSVKPLVERVFILSGLCGYLYFSPRIADGASEPFGLIRSRVNFLKK
jgi:hypothetical protein